MIFSELFFIYCFLAFFFLLYFIIRDIRWKNAVLIIFSLAFYAFGELYWILILLFSTGVNFFAGIMIEKHPDNNTRKKLGVAVCLVTCLGLLCAFKYSGFAAENINAVLGTAIPVPKPALPLGISFYMFRLISYTLDVYWGKVNAQGNFLKFLLYISIFSTIIAGPITRYSSMKNELSVRKTDIVQISGGITRFITGLGKKVIIADNLIVVVNDFFGGDISKLSVMGTWYAVILFALWVYFDFSGYSDMAIGIGGIIGFKFDENFNYPFICKNITEFWQRWHISLGSFFRDYLLYLPIFGKRRQILNLFLVWFCTGLWHGASWNYVIWGLYFGVFIFIERKIGNKRMKKIPRPVLHIYNKLIIIIGFGIFYFTDINKLGQFFMNLAGAGGNAFTDAVTETSFMNNIFLFTAAALLCLPVIPALKKKFRALNDGRLGGDAIRTAVNLALLIVCSLMMVNSTSQPFLYANF